MAWSWSETSSESAQPSEQTLWWNVFPVQDFREYSAAITKGSIQPGGIWISIFRSKCDIFGRGRRDVRVHLYSVLQSSAMIFRIKTDSGQMRNTIIKVRCAGESRTIVYTASRLRWGDLGGSRDELSGDVKQISCKKAHFGWKGIAEDT